MSTVNSVDWFELYVQDMARARAFYEAVLGIALEPLKLPQGSGDGLEMWSFPGDMNRHGANGALCRMPGVPSGPGGTLVYFACEDCGATSARVAPAGGRVHREKTSIGEYGFIALAFDPDGNMIGLHSMTSRRGGACRGRAPHRREPSVKRRSRPRRAPAAACVRVRCG